MKKVLFTLMCLVAMMAAGTSLKAQDVTITLSPGWNWISYPNAEVMNIATALGDFIPVQGDMIKSQGNGQAIYSNGRWLGSLSYLIPGRGYMYYSSRNEFVEFVFAKPSSNVVATAMPTDITATSAISGGTVTIPEGGHVFLCGLCWGTEPNPDIDGNHISHGEGIGDFNDTLVGLTSSNTYYVRAYAVTDYGLVYGEEFNFTTDHGYVDLGLPSGTLWATCNVGAETPEDFGDYIAWGETQPRDTYNWSNYQHCMGDYYSFTKYCTDSDYGYNGFTDNLTTLLPEDDAATANWGSDWRMPTKEEWQELYNNTTCTWTTQNGINGRLFTASNGNSLFLPAAGCRNYSSLYYAGSFGYYWSSSLITDYPYDAWILGIGSDYYGMGGFTDRCSGQSVRAVRDVSFNINTTTHPTDGGTVTGDGNYHQGQSCTLTATANASYYFVNWTENGEVVSTDATYTFTVQADRTLVANFTYICEYVDLGLPSGLLWATCNVGATVPEEYGDYFAWGETSPKEWYGWSNYQYCTGGNYEWPLYNMFTKYCNDSIYGYNGFTDTLTILLPEDDAATANWGNGWRMPTYDEWQELYNNTAFDWTTQNGVNGTLFTASNGNSLFLPAAGFSTGELYNDGSRGYYWSSWLYPYQPYKALDVVFISYDLYFYGQRNFGHSVRAVRSASQN